MAASTCAHGTSTRYVNGCRCEQCRLANRLRQRQASRRKLAIAYGMEAPTLVDATRVRAHLQMLTAAGMGRRRIAHVAGVSVTVVARLTGLEHSRPAARVRPDTERKLLAVTPDLAPGALTDAMPTVRMVTSLVALGWPLSTLSARAGLPVRRLYGVARLGDGDRVTVRTQERVREIFDLLCATPGPSQRARRLAQRRGWLAPLAYDDVCAGVVADQDADSDGCAVCEDVDFLLSAGASADLCSRLGMSALGLEQHLHRHGRRELARRVRRLG